MKLLLIEDDRQIAQIMHESLTRAGYEIDYVPDGVQGFELLASFDYATAIVDLKLPGIDGLSIIERARSLHIQTPILVVTAKRSVPERVRGLSAGADDYLIKPFSVAELEARVGALIRRARGVTPPTILRCADLELDLIARTARRADGPLELQPLEFELLKYLAENQGRVVSRATLIRDVWKYNFDPETNIVEVRMSKIRDKVDRNRNVALIHTIRGVGYVLKVAP